MTVLKCYFCASEDDIKFCILQLVPGSAGIIRPVCVKCRETKDVSGKEKTK
jgi:hypothetical protein